MGEEELRIAIKNKETLLLGTASDICFVVMGESETYDNIYFNIIEKVISSYGLRSVRTKELSIKGRSLLDDVRTTILQSKFIICDITSQSPNVMYELGIAVESKKTIILLTQRSEIPYHVSELYVIKYKDTPAGLIELYDTLKKHIHKILFVDPVGEAKQLHKEGFFGPAVIAINSYLELTLQNLFLKKYDIPPGKMRFGKMVEKLKNVEIINNDDIEKIFQWREIRNKIIHSGYRPKPEETADMIKGIDNFVKGLKSYLK